MKSTESLLSELQCEGKHYRYYDLTKLNDPRVDQLPKSLKILLENQLRHFDGENVGQEIIDALLNWVDTGTGGDDINFSPVLPFCSCYEITISGCSLALMNFLRQHQYPSRAVKRSKAAILLLHLLTYARFITVPAPALLFVARQ